MFIYERQNVLPPPVCEALIDNFEKSDLKKPGRIGYQSDSADNDIKKLSTDISFTPDMAEDKVWGSLLGAVIDHLTINLELYYQRFTEAFVNLDPLEISPVFNMQRYLPGEGFFGYHCEAASERYSSRQLVWMIYLNTPISGGETEFYFQKKFIVPEIGKLVIWPSAWMYLHRGVTSYTSKKYILTGWCNFKKL